MLCCAYLTGAVLNIFRVPPAKQITLHTLSHPHSREQLYAESAQVRDFLGTVLLCFSVTSYNDAGATWRGCWIGSFQGPRRGTERGRIRHRGDAVVRRLCQYRCVHLSTMLTHTAWRSQRTAHSAQRTATDNSDPNVEQLTDLACHSYTFSSFVRRDCIPTTSSSL